MDKVNSPEDIKGLTIDELEILCTEIRQYMIDCCSRNPGHLGSSLGAVELIVGLHYVYDTPQDKIVFDVGHQAYAHKILTGRRKAFCGLRTRNGISGFPKMSESPYDAFGAGHSSTSISAALGLARAAKMNGDNSKVIAIIGDGALTGGLAIEGLNNAGASGDDLLIVLNDNDQSIDDNIGAFHEYLLKLTTSSRYNSLKKKIWDHMGEGSFRSLLQKITKDTKSNLVRSSGGAFFESLGFRYFGPIDGNNIGQVVNAFRRIRNLSGPRILHVCTTKGKGYPAAEKDPVVWHAPGRFNPETGERIPTQYKADRYQDVFGKVLLDLARKDKRILGITPAMATGCGMTAFAKELPGQFFDVGIEEEHAVTFSAGLAAGGMKPVCNIYSSFSQRAYDQIIHDVALQGLSVVFCLDRSGLVGEDGPTHNGCYDLSFLRPIPGVTIAAPSDETDLKNMMYSSLQDSHKGPYIIRYPRGCGEGRDWEEGPYEEIPLGKARLIGEGERIAVLALGPEAWRAMEAREVISEKFGFRPAVWDMRFLKPVDTEAIQFAATHFDAILTVEEGAIKGGLYSEVTEFLSSNDLLCHVHGVGIPDRFIREDKQSSQRAECSLDCGGIVAEIEKLIKISRKDLQNVK